MTTAVDPRFRLSESQAKDLKKQFGTPLYVIDETHFRAKIRRYLSAAKAAYAKSEISFASKANSTLALLAIAAQEGCQIDVASEGELRAAMAAGVSPAKCHLHGNNKTEQEIVFALDAQIGMIVVDHFREIEMIASRLTPAHATKLVLRLAPGVDPITHAKISTGQADTKFGFNIADGSAEKAMARCLELGLPLIGFHCHVGSQLLDPQAQRSGGELIGLFAKNALEKYNLRTEYLNVGGGLGVVYTDADQPMVVEEYCRLIAESTQSAIEGTGLAPVLSQEPGRSLIAESGVTLYEVGVIKTVPAKEGSRTYVCVDGGLSDNPRPAFYGSAYTVEKVGVTEKKSVVTVSGKHCETDKLFPDIELASDLREGDLIQVLSTGAYNASMASNYNRYPRPATALIRENGSLELIQRRDTWDEMLAREIVPKDLTV